jgi:hypothetical protein
MVTVGCRGLLVALSLYAVSGCDVAPRTATSVATDEGAPRTISEQEKKEALSLSLGNLGIMSEATSPYSRAMLCVIALETMSERLGELGQANAAISYGEILRRSSGIYAQEVRSIAAREGKTSSQIAQDRKQHAAQIPELSFRGQIAINCLRSVANSGVTPAKAGD